MGLPLAEMGGLPQEQAWEEDGDRQEMVGTMGVGDSARVLLGEPLHTLVLHASVFFALLGLGLGRLSATSAELWAMPRPLLGSFPSDAQPWWQAQGTGIYLGPVCPLS